MNTLNKIDRGLCRFFKLMGYAAGIVGALMMILSVINVIARQLFTAPIFGTVEIVSYAGLLLGAFALAYNESGDGNITMTLLTDSMKPAPKSICELLTSLLAAVFYGAIAYRYFAEVLTTMAKRTVTQTVGIPMWVINLIMAIGFAVATLALLLKCLRCAVFFAGAGSEDADTQQEGGTGK